MTQVVGGYTLADVQDNFFGGKLQAWLSCYSNRFCGVIPEASTKQAAVVVPNGALDSVVWSMQPALAFVRTARSYDADVAKVAGVALAVAH